MRPPGLGLHLSDRNGSRSRSFELFRKLITTASRRSGVDENLLELPPEARTTDDREIRAHRFRDTLGPDDPAGSACSSMRPSALARFQDAQRPRGHLEISKSIGEDHGGWPWRVPLWPMEEILETIRREPATRSQIHPAVDHRSRPLAHAMRPDQIVARDPGGLRCSLSGSIRHAETLSVRRHAVDPCTKAPVDWMTQPSCPGSHRRAIHKGCHLDRDGRLPDPDVSRLL